MKARTITNKLFFPVIAGCLISIALPINTARADYLVRPVPVQFVECVNCGCTIRAHKHHYKHHATKKHHYRYSRCYGPGYGCPVIAAPCSYRARCAQPVEFVNFIGEPAPRNRARWVNTFEYDNYDPDMSTGDDDPTVYPGMNIDN